MAATRHRRRSLSGVGVWNGDLADRERIKGFDGPAPHDPDDRIGLKPKDPLLGGLVIRVGSESRGSRCKTKRVKESPRLATLSLWCESTREVLTVRPTLWVPWRAGR